MKKIMFNDKYGLTLAVLEDRKAMTRRIISYPSKFRGQNVAGYYVCRKPSGELVEVCLHDEDERMIDAGQIFPNFQVEEVVAIAQSYKDSGYDPDSLDRHPKDLSIRGLMKDSAGWNNKMFVKSYACKHHIKITNVKVERLQDISDEDCLKEGVYRLDSANGSGGIAYSFAGASDKKHIGLYDTPREAFADLINKVSGKGTWERNSFVWVYEFKLFD
ncbi:hypothetical protein KSY24_21310 [Bacteroides thetaiotaomicron]|jgi:hypothetical protein|uniref:hypothetical protein n=1 Tax=Bacteroides thetaiotaomicron TaxID=818 RepID=UPI001C37AEBB|nr:hypothetical protein [Bacteroides thetaiotaomicron]DAI80520.1 MAG TPA: ASCH domain protein [Caudoviricetes sp.]MBV3856270.1 hypothetical protein [Bacteroides thetaiotaomicron]MBV3928913.1 hypothetical protein [Bacteroides thetaiotaomicron]MBV3934105.1 hypothetical protein [Bacteroides thetaiotaomicron]MBV3943080.1 hypothetical protein [Bacteroides thetaiotaomicron]